MKSVYSIKYEVNVGFWTGILVDGSSPGSDVSLRVGRVKDPQRTKVVVTDFRYGQSDQYLRVRGEFVVKVFGVGLIPVIKGFGTWQTILDHNSHHRMISVNPESVPYPESHTIENIKRPVRGSD